MVERTEQRMKKIEKVLQRRQLDLTVVLENVHDPHNVSAVLRTCDSVGIYKVYLVYNRGQKFPDLSKRSSASALKWVEIEFFDDVEKCYELLRKRGMKIYTTSFLKNAKSLYELNLIEPAALVFGNEHTGISNEGVALADGNFLIPQVGMIESLNISVACAVSLYEAFRQRSLVGKYEVQQIETALFEAIYKSWLIR